MFTEYLLLLILISTTSTSIETIPFNTSKECSQRKIEIDIALSTSISLGKKKLEMSTLCVQRSSRYERYMG